MSKTAALDRINLSGMKLEEMFVINPNSFPGKLWQLVNDPEIGSICWDASGTVIIIHQQRFVSEVLLYQTKRTNEYFKTKDFTSIVRQLNLYGFRKLRLVSDASEHQPDCFSVRHQPHHFHNPNFERDKPELLVNLKRLTLANKAKLALGKQHHGFSQGVSHVMLKSPQKMSSTVMIKGSLYQHNSNGPEQVMECEKTSRSFQAFVHGDASPRILFTNNFDSPCAHSCSSVHVPHGAMPHHLQHRIYTQVYQGCTSAFLDPNMPCLPQLAASYPAFDYYSDYSIKYPYPADPTSGGKTGMNPDSRRSEMRQNMDTVSKQAAVTQAPAAVREVPGAENP